MDDYLNDLAMKQRIKQILEEKIHMGGVLVGGKRRRMTKRKPSAHNMRVKAYMKKHGVTLPEASHAVSMGKRGTMKGKKRMAPVKRRAPVKRMKRKVVKRKPLGKRRYGRAIDLEDMYGMGVDEDYEEYIAKEKMHRKNLMKQTREKLSRFVPHNASERQIYSILKKAQKQFPDYDAEDLVGQLTFKGTLNEKNANKDVALVLAEEIIGDKFLSLNKFIMESAKKKYLKSQGYYPEEEEEEEKRGRSRGPRTRSLSSITPAELASLAP